MSEPTAPDNAAAEGAAAPGSAEVQPEPQAPQKPEIIPDKFWDVEAGQPRVEDLAKSYAGLESLLGKRVDQLDETQREQLFDVIPDKALQAAREKLKQDEGFVAELMEAQRAAVPEKYEVPAEILPEGVEGIDEEHPLYQGAVEFAKEHGLAQDAFNKLVQQGIQLLPDARPLEARMKEVGADFDARARATMTAARNVLGEDQREALEALEGRLYEPSEFAAYEALVKAATRETPPQPADSKPTPTITQEQLDQRVRDPRYRKDPTFRAETERLFQELHDRGSTL
jgi:hypothetical protein